MLFRSERGREREKEIERTPRQAVERLSDRVIQLTITEGRSRPPPLPLLSPRQAGRRPVMAARSSPCPAAPRPAPPSRPPSLFCLHISLCLSLCPSVPLCPPRSLSLALSFSFSRSHSCITSPVASPLTSTVPHTIPQRRQCTLPPAPSPIRVIDHIHRAASESIDHIHKAASESSTTYIGRHPSHQPHRSVLQPVHLPRVPRERERGRGS